MPIPTELPPSGATVCTHVLGKTPAGLNVGRKKRSKIALRAIGTSLWNFSGRMSICKQQNLVVSFVPTARKRRGIYYFYRHFTPNGVAFQNSNLIQTYLHTVAP
jgi:hypothetical protein